jgi:uncharacterized protein (TIGR02001 family)
MNRTAQSWIAAALLLGSITTVRAGEIAANVTLTSDYPFRGVSQTTRDPAIQGGFDYAFDSGFYIGTWASNVSFGVTSLEWDLYAGFAGQITEDVGYDLVYIRYEYPGAGSELDYNEFGASIAWKDLTFGLMYSPKYFALNNVTWWYPYVEYSFGLPYEASLDLKVGLSIVDDNSAKDFEDAFGDDRVVDWSVMYTIPVAGVDLAIGYVGTDVSRGDCFGGSKDCRPRPVVSVSKSL